MKNIIPQKAPRATTTVSISRGAHAILRRLARQKDMTITQYLEVLAGEADRCERRGQAMRPRIDNDCLNCGELLVKLATNIDTLLKRKQDRDVIVSFFRMQEKEILTPMRNDIVLLSGKLDAVISAIQSLSH